MGKFWGTAALLLAVTATWAHADEDLPGFCVVGGSLPKTCVQLRQCAGVRLAQNRRLFGIQCGNPIPGDPFPKCTAPSASPDGVLFGADDAVCGPSCSSRDSGPGSGRHWQRIPYEDGGYCLRLRREPAVTAYFGAPRTPERKKDSDEALTELWDARKKEQSVDEGWMSRLAAWRKMAGAKNRPAGQNAKADAIVKAWNTLKAQTTPKAGAVDKVYAAIVAWRDLVDSQGPLPLQKDDETPEIAALRELRDGLMVTSEDPFARGIEELSMVLSCRVLGDEMELDRARAQTVCPPDPTEKPATCGQVDLAGNSVVP